MIGIMVNDRPQLPLDASKPTYALTTYLSNETEKYSPKTNDLITILFAQFYHGLLRIS